MASSPDVFSAPELPWPKNELAKKGISVETVEYHYGKHHLGYVRKLNVIAANDQAVAKSSIEELVVKGKGKPFEMAAQIWNHNIYWDGMSKDGGGEPTGALGEQINKDFGSFAKFREQFTNLANGHFGSGWIWLSWDPKSHKLVVSEGHDAGNPLRDGLTPLLTIDVWEHAFYIDHKNDKAAYVEVWWKCVDWSRVAKKFHPK